MVALGVARPPCSSRPNTYGGYGLAKVSGIEESKLKPSCLGTSGVLIRGKA